MKTRHPDVVWRELSVLEAEVSLIENTISELLSPSEFCEDVGAIADLWSYALEHGALFDTPLIEAGRGAGYEHLYYGIATPMQRENARKINAVKIRKWAATKFRWTTVPALLNRTSPAISRFVRLLVQHAVEQRSERVGEMSRTFAQVLTGLDVIEAGRRDLSAIRSSRYYRLQNEFEKGSRIIKDYSRLGS